MVTDITTQAREGVPPSTIRHWLVSRTGIVDCEEGHDL